MAEPRAPQAIIAEACALARAARVEGKDVAGVPMSREEHRALMRWAAGLGEAKDEGFEYLKRYELFGLPILIE